MIGFFSSVWCYFLRSYFPCMSRGHSTTFRHHSTARCMVLDLKYALSVAPYLRYLANVIYEFILSHIFIEHLLGAMCRTNRL